MQCTALSAVYWNELECKMMQYSAVHCSQCSVLQWNGVKMMQYSAVQCSQCSVSQWNAVKIVQNIAVQCSQCLLKATGRRCNLHPWPELQINHRSLCFAIFTHFLTSHSSSFSFLHIFSISFIIILVFFFYIFFISHSSSSSFYTFFNFLSSSF